ncbi:hypothetical protein [Methylobacterium marchantiae]|uniref:EamA family transporter n=1 Tax=Methylobacterium marchantiae TaxID=600331 RepID=A0ABW3WUA8_9HYPH
MTRPFQVKPFPRRSLFRAGASSRLLIAAILSGLVWGAIFWAMG